MYVRGWCTNNGVIIISERQRQLCLTFDKLRESRSCLDKCCVNVLTIKNDNRLPNSAFTLGHMSLDMSSDMSNDKLPIGVNRVY